MVKKIFSAIYYKLIATILNVKNYRDLRNLINWSKDLYSMPAPPEVKIKTLMRWGTRGVWIETGTYEGLTTIELSKFARQVITLEPSRKYYELASKNLAAHSNIELVNGTSEDSLDLVLNKLVESNNISDLSFWLDAHFSSGETFKGEKDSPIIEELRIIQNYLAKIIHLTIFIDDVRLFRDDRSMPEHFPDLSKVLDWAQLNKLIWTIEHDILIISK